MAAEAGAGAAGSSAIEVGTEPMRDVGDDAINARGDEPPPVFFPVGSPGPEAHLASASKHHPSGSKAAVLD